MPKSLICNRSYNTLVCLNYEPSLSVCLGWRRMSAFVGVLVRRWKSTIILKRGKALIMSDSLYCAMCIICYLWYHRSPHLLVTYWITWWSSLDQWVAPAPIIVVCSFYYISHSKHKGFSFWPNTRLTQLEYITILSSELRKVLIASTSISTLPGWNSLS